MWMIQTRRPADEVMQLQGRLQRVMNDVFGPWPFDSDSSAVDVSDVRQIDDDLAPACGDHLVHVAPEREVAIVNGHLAGEGYHCNVVVLVFSDL